MTKVIYRDLQSRDFSALQTLVSDWLVVRQLGSWPWPADTAFTRARCAPYTGTQDAGFIWAICHDDRLIGTMGVTDGIVGYMLLPSYHGQGIITQALQRGIDHAFATQSRSFLTATTWFDNHASRHILLKHRFQHWQTRYRHAKVRHRPTLAYEYRLDRSDWHSLRASTK